MSQSVLSPRTQIGPVILFCSITRQTGLDLLQHSTLLLPGFTDRTPQPVHPDRPTYRSLQRTRRDADLTMAVKPQWIDLSASQAAQPLRATLDGMVNTGCRPRRSGLRRRRLWLIA